MVKLAPTDPKEPTAFDRICFVPSRAEQSNVSSVPDTLTVSANLKRDTGKTEDSLCDRIQLEGVNVLLVPFGRTNLCEDSPVFDSLVHNLLRRCAHHWGLSL
jgi:hypothetical protein